MRSHNTAHTPLQIQLVKRCKDGENVEMVVRSSSGANRYSMGIGVEVTRRNLRHDAWVF